MKLAGNGEGAGPFGAHLRPGPDLLADEASTVTRKPAWLSHF